MNYSKNWLSDAFMVVRTVSIPCFVMRQNLSLCGGAHYVDIMVTDINRADPIATRINHPLAATARAAAQRQRYQATC